LSGPGDRRIRFSIFMKKFLSTLSTPRDTRNFRSTLVGVCISIPTQLWSPGFPHPFAGCLSNDFPFFQIVVLPFFILGLIPSFLSPVGASLRILCLFISIIDAGSAQVLSGAGFPFFIHVSHSSGAGIFPVAILGMWSFFVFFFFLGPTFFYSHR